MVQDCSGVSPLGSVLARLFLCRRHGPTPGKERRSREGTVNSQTPVSLVHTPATPALLGRIWS